MMIFKKAIPRRTFLHGVGGSLALPLLEGMLPAFATAADVAAIQPLRMSVVYAPMGKIQSKWLPATEGPNYEITPILQPLTPFRDKFLVVSGLDSKPAFALPGEGGSFHSRTTASFMTGAHMKHTQGKDIHLGTSFDQIAAKVLGKQTQLASLEISLDPAEIAGDCEHVSCVYENTLCWQSPTSPLPMETEPRAVFERLFGDSDTTDRAARLAVQKRNSSLLDAFTAAVAHLQTGLPPNDRAKLTEYLDAIRDLERRIQIAEQQNQTELPTLERPGASLPASFEDYAKLMFDLEVLAFQTDMTRIATYRIARESSGRTYPQIGVPDAHHPCTHHQGVAATIEKVVKINTYHVKLFSYFLEKLRSTPDGNGTLLDHSVILYGSGMSDGNFHTNVELPILLAGGGGGKIKGGRHLRYPKGTPLSNLQVAMLDMMGIPSEHFGDSTGELPVLSIS